MIGCTDPENTDRATTCFLNRLTFFTLLIEEATLFSATDFLTTNGLIAKVINDFVNSGSSDLDVVGDDGGKDFPKALK